MPGLQDVVWRFDLDARLNSYGTLFLFLPPVIGVYWLLPKNRQRLAWLAVASIAFYSFWDWRFTPLLLFSVAMDYWLAFKAANGNKTWMWISVVLNLGILAVFKYLVFAVTSINNVADWFNASGHLPVPDIVLPIGISFYLFHTMSYTIDAYRGTITPTRDFVKFTAYVLLFPQLVAGPIVRYSEIGEQLAEKRTFDRNEFHLGAERLVLGLAKKVLVADFIASRIDPFWLPGVAVSPLGVATIFVGFALQIYFDFAGYTDMALGVARMMGYGLPENFDRPYTATNPADIWRRWHMSLTRFIRDYVYVPLGGNRRGPFENVVIVLVTWALVGLWHGANWTSVVWGLWNGTAILIYRAIRTFWNRMPRWMAQLVTFTVWTFGLGIFRSHSIGHFINLLSDGKSFGWAPSLPQLVFMLIGLLAVTLLPPPRIHHPFWRPALVGCIGGLALVSMNNAQEPFFYFQF